MEVAVEAYRVVHDRAPVSDAELVSAGFLRRTSNAFDLADGVVVAVPRSDCAEFRHDGVAAPTTSTVEPSPTPAPSVTGSIPSDDSDTCATLDAVIAGVAEIEDVEIPQLVARLAAAATRLREARAHAEPMLRPDLQSVAFVADMFSDQVTQLDRARSTADVETSRIVGELIDSIPGFVRSFFTREKLTSSAPSLASACDIPWGDSELDHDLRTFFTAIAAFSETDLADDERFAFLRALQDAVADPDRGTTAMSELVAEFEQCRDDPFADGYGDNAGCDALHDACADRDLLACNDLYFSSPFTSGYETFGASCGQRAGFGDFGFGGFCEELDP